MDETPEESEERMDDEADREDDGQYDWPEISQDHW
jgi:hypothetical protein